jgi:hypothetical protein
VEDVRRVIHEEFVRWFSSADVGPESRQGVAAERIWAAWKRRHQSINEQGEWLRSVVRGHFAYFGVPTNSPSLGTFRTQIPRH